MIRRIPVFLVVAAMLVGCATGADERGGARVTNDLQFYELYDNSRDWGPSFLVGPPNHHQGNETRINDFRALPPGATTPSPQMSPPSGSPPSIPTEPLPQVP